MNTAVIFAGGIGRRMNSGSLPKQFLKVDGKEIIVHTLEHYENHPEIDAVVIACVADWIGYLEKILESRGFRKIRRIVPGGETGQDSIYNGLCAADGVERETGTADRTIVLIHDGVRPLIDEATITACLKSVREHGSAVTTAPLVETVIRVGGDFSVEDVVERDRCLVARAPQCFYLDEILRAHEQAREDGRHDFIDSATLMSGYGHSLTVVPGPVDNIKITTPKDYYTFKGLYEARHTEEEI